MEKFEKINTDIINLLKEKGFTIKKWHGSSIRPKNSIYENYRALREDINIFIKIQELE